jgi:hypothetical protein
MLMNPSVNINGTSREALVDSRRDAFEAVHAAMNALRETLPHGRDYVGRAHQWSVDRAIYMERHAMLSKLAEDLMEEAVAIQNAGPKGGA